MKVIGASTIPTGGAATVVVSFPATHGIPHKVVIKISSTDLLYRAYEIMAMVTPNGSMISGYGVIGDVIPHGIQEVIRTGNLDLEIMNYHTSPLNVEVLDGTGASSTQAFI